jgi:hypothetical protein
MKSIQGKPQNQWEMYCLNEYAKATNKLHPIFCIVDPLNRTNLDANHLQKIPTHHCKL